MTRLIALIAIHAGVALALQQNPLGEPDPFPKKEFDQRIDEYMKIRKKAVESVPPLKAKAEPEEIAAHKLALAGAIKTARADAVQGEIFTPTVREAIVKIVKSEMRGKAGAPAKATVEQGNPKTEAPGSPVPLKVNAKYTDEAPLSSVPPSLLLRLPELPKGLTFRFVGGNLVLLDGGAGIIVDFIPNIIKL